MIRKATKKDLGNIESLIKSVKGFWDDHWRADVVGLGIESSSGLAFIYESNDEVLGFICAHDVGFRGYLSELIVAPKVQKKGIGKLLLKKVEEELQERGCHTLIADVWKNAEKFYTNAGWSQPNVILLRKKLK